MAWRNSDHIYTFSLMAKEAHVPKAGEQLSLAASTGSMQLIRIQKEFFFTVV
jgi:hypothetical protein